MAAWAAEIAIATVFCGCQVNVSSLETIVSDPLGKSFGFALTFLQFAFIAATALPESLTWKKGSLYPVLRPRQLRLDHLCAMAFIFWLVSVINNVVFVFDVSMPVHTLFRSSSMVVNVATGYIFFGKRYTRLEIACAVLVTGGLAMLTIATSSKAALRVESGQPEETKLEAQWKFYSWVAGIATLLVSAVLSASLGLLQDYVYAEARKSNRGGADAVPRWKEALMYSHLMTLPLFAATGYRQIAEGFVTLPSELYPYVALNVISQLLCIRGVYTLTDTTSAFVMTLTITLRKFVSLLISVFYFGHYRDFTLVHWLAIAMVMVGGPLFPIVKRFESGAKPAIKEKKA